MDRISILLITLVFAAGCTSTTQQRIIPSRTPSMPIFTATLTATLIKTITPIPSPTWTPLPTVPPENLQQVILDLVKTNKGCEYPCWWGIKPGETDWYTAEAFLKSLSPKFLRSATGKFVTVTVPLPENWSYYSSLSSTLFIQNGLVTSISTFTDYSIADFLSAHGKPKEIWIAYHEFEFQPPFYRYSIALDYSDRGFAVLYGKEVSQDDSRHLCPYRSYETQRLTDGYGTVHTIDHHIFALSLWNPEQNISFQEMISFHYETFATNEIFRRLSEITNLNVEQFSEMYMDPNTRKCIEIKEAS